MTSFSRLKVSEEINPTLWVILGPFWASEACAKKRNVAVKMSKTEITRRCRLAIVWYAIDDLKMKVW